MKVNLTLFPWDFENESINQFKIEVKEQPDFGRNEAEQKLYDWIFSKQDKESVFVCFQENETQRYKDNIDTFLMSHNHIEILTFCETRLNKNSNGLEFVKFNIFEFPSYKEAAIYIKDLREGV